LIDILWELLADYDIDGKKLCPTALAFRDWWIRTITLMPEEWCLRLGRILQRDLFANFSESWHLFHGIVFPSTSVYILERRKSGFTEPSIVRKTKYLKYFRMPSYKSIAMYELVGFAFFKCM
jgi:hypothetical protein